jgi:hypothetical protein
MKARPRTTEPTPPPCTHCGQPMRFQGAWPALSLEDLPPGMWEERWGCPERRWSMSRVVPAPPGYGGLPTTIAARRARRTHAPKSKTTRRRKSR